LGLMSRFDKLNASFIPRSKNDRVIQKIGSSIILYLTLAIYYLITVESG